MKLSGLLHRTRSELPGVTGVARVDRHTEALLRRLRPGDIAVLDQVDLDRATADALVAAEVAAVVNASPVDLRALPQPRAARSSSTPASRWSTRSAPRCCTPSRTAAGSACTTAFIYAGEQVLAEGVAQTAESVADALVEAKSGLAHQLEAFAANTIEFMRRERAMLLDGVGVPDVRGRPGRPPGARRRGGLRPRRGPGPAAPVHPRVPAAAGRRGRGRGRAARGRAHAPT